MGFRAVILLLACLSTCFVGRSAGACVKGLHCHTVADAARLLAWAEWLLLNRRHAEAGAEVLKHWPGLHRREAAKLSGAGPLRQQAAHVLAVAALRQRGRPFTVGRKAVRVNPRWARAALGALRGPRPGHAGAVFVGGALARRVAPRWEGALAARRRRGAGRRAAQPVDALLRALGSKGPARRQRAASAAAALGSAAVAATDALVERVRSDPDPGVRVAAARALGRIHHRAARRCKPDQAGCRAPPTSVVEALLGNLGHEVLVVRQAALDALGRVAPWRSPNMGLLSRALRDPSPLVRIEAVNTIGMLGRAGAALGPALLKLLDGGDAELREVAAYALARMVPLPEGNLSRWVGYLEGGAYRAPYRDPRCGSQEPLRRLAARALAAMGPRAAPAARALAMNLGRGRIEREVLEALRRVGPRAIPALRGVLAGNDSHAKRAALSVLAALGKHHARAIPLILSAFEDGDSFVRDHAVRVLVYECGKQAVPALCKGLHSTRARTRQLGAEALAGLKQAAGPCAGQLVELLGEGAGTQHAAERALRAIGPAVIPLVIRALGHERAGVREAAARVLGSFGKRATPALATLVKLMDDPAPGVRGAAAWALGQLGPAARSAVPVLLRGVVKRGAGARVPCIDALGRVGEASDAVLAALVAVAGEPGCHQKRGLAAPREALVALGRLGKATPQVTHALRQTLGSRSLHCRVCAARALARLGYRDRDVLRALLRGLPDRTDRDLTEHEQLRIRIVAAQGVAHAGEAARRAAPLLGRMLVEQWTYDKPRLRRAAARALVALGRHGVRTLARAINSSSSTVREEAAAALLKIGARIGAAVVPALPAVARAMDSYWYHPRELVLHLKLVGAVGPRAGRSPRLVKLVRRAASDEREAVRRAASAALQQIAGAR
jgi:HEAT repeat protein